MENIAPDEAKTREMISQAESLCKRTSKRREEANDIPKEVKYQMVQQDQQDWEKGDMVNDKTNFSSPKVEDCPFSRHLKMFEQSREVVFHQQLIINNLIKDRDKLKTENIKLINDTSVLADSLCKTRRKKVLLESDRRRFTAVILELQKKLSCTECDAADVERDFNLQTCFESPEREQNLEVQIKLVKSGVAFLKRKISVMDRQLLTKESEMAALLKEKEELKTDFEQRVDSLDKEKHDLSVQLDQYCIDIKKMLDEKDTEAEALRRSLDESDNQIAVLKRENDDLRNLIAILERNNDVTNKRLSSLESSFQNIQSAYDIQSREFKSCRLSYSNKLEDFTKKCQQNEELRAMLESSQKEKIDLARKIEKEIESNQKLTLQLQQSNNSVEELRNLKAKYEIKIACLGEYQQSVLLKMNESNNLNSTSSKYPDEETKMQLDYAELGTRDTLIQEMQRELKKIIVQKDKIKEELSKHKEYLLQIQESTENLQEEAIKAQEHVEEKGKEIQELQKTVNEMISANHSLHAQKEADAAKQWRMREESEVMLRDLRNCLSQLQGILNSYSAEGSSEFKEWYDEMQRLRGEKTTDLKKAFQTLIKAKDAKIFKLKSELASTFHTLEDLTKSTVREKLSISQTIKQHELLAASYYKLQRENVNNKRKLAELEEATKKQLQNHHQRLNTSNVSRSCNLEKPKNVVKDKRSVLNKQKGNARDCLRKH